MSKLSNISSKPMVVSYAQGAAQRAVQPVASFLAPAVEVSTGVGRYKKYTSKSRFRLPDTRRNLGGRAAQLGYSASDENYNCEPHALDFPVDNLEKLEAGDLENVFREGADEVAAVSGLVHEKTVIDKALAAVGAGTSLSVGGSDDVIDQIDAAILTVIKAAKYGSLMGVGLLFGANFWKTTKNHASVRARYVSGGKNQFAVPDLNDFGSLLISKPDCRVSLMVYDDAPEGKDEDIKFVLDSGLIVFARMEQPNRRDPSFMKTFRLRGQWMLPGAYETEDGRGEVAKMDWSEDVRVTNEAAAVRLNVA